MAETLFTFPLLFEHIAWNIVGNKYLSDLYVDYSSKQALFGNLSQTEILFGFHE